MIGLRIPDCEKNKLAALAVSNDTTISSIVRNLIYDYLDKENEK